MNDYAVNISGTNFPEFPALISPPLSERVSTAIRSAQNNSPSDLRKTHKIRLQIYEAEEVCSILNESGICISPYDFPGTLNVWKSKDKSGIPYTQLATSMLISSIGEKLNADPAEPEGFKKLLPYLTIDNFRHFPINHWGTTLGGMISDTQYSCSPSKAVLDAVNNLGIYAKIRAIGLSAWDFQEVPNYFWLDKQDRPTENARMAIKEVLKTKAQHLGVDYKTYQGILVLTGYLKSDELRNLPINYWGTRINGGFIKAYNSNKLRALTDLIRYDEEFRAFRKNFLRFLKMCARSA